MDTSQQKHIKIIEVDPWSWKRIPLGTSGCYAFIDLFSKEYLYVGKAKDLRKRLYQYTELSYTKAYEKFNRMLDEGHCPLVLLFPTKKDGEKERLEDNLVKEKRPKYNFRKEF